MHGKGFTGDSSFTFSLRLNSSVQNQLPWVVSWTVQRICTAILIKHDQQLHRSLVCYFDSIASHVAWFIAEDSLRFSNECHACAALSCILLDSSVCRHVHAALHCLVRVLQTLRMIQQDDSYTYWMRQCSVIPSIHPSIPASPYAEGKAWREWEVERIEIPSRFWLHKNKLS